MPAQPDPPARPVAPRAQRVPTTGCFAPAQSVPAGQSGLTGQSVPAGPSVAPVVTPPDSGFDEPERRLQGLLDLFPYVMLLVGLLLDRLTEQPTTGSLLITIAVAAAAAAWMLWWVTLHPGWAQRRTLAAVYYTGLIALGGVLVARSPWFAFFVWIGFIHAWRFLPGRWRYLGIAATAMLMGVCQSAGYHRPTVALVAIYLSLAGLNAGLMLLFSRLTQVTTEQNQARKLMIAELADANHRLEATLAENRDLHALLVAQAREAGITEERQRIAREIHDTLAQGLTGIVTQLEAAGLVRERDGRSLDRHLQNANQLARDSLAEARRSVHALRPAALDGARLADALATEARAWSRLHQVPAEVACTGTARPLHPETEITLLRVAQEALANVAKHARASRVRLTLSYMEDLVTLDVRDDGIGFERPNGRAAEPADRNAPGGASEVKGTGKPKPAAGTAGQGGAAGSSGSSAGRDGGTGSSGSSAGRDGGAGSSGSSAGQGGGFGLTAMRQRVDRLAGRLEIESEAGAGTAVSAAVPAVPPGGTI